MSDIVARLRAHGSKTEMEAADEIERLRQIYFDRVKEQADEVKRLQALKTPASAQLLNITKAALDDAEAEIERLRGAIRP